MKTKFALPLAFGLLLTAFAGPAAHSAEPEQKSSAAARQAVLVYDTTGGFSPVMESLIVYSDGLSVLSCSRGGSDKITRTTAPAAQVQTLQKALKAAGALTLPSSTKPIPDIPLKIVTFFKAHKGAGQTLSNTFSYVDVTGSYGAVQSAIDSFLKSVFPAC